MRIRSATFGVAFFVGLLLFVPVRDARAQGPANMGAPRDSSRIGLHFVYLVRHGWYDHQDPRDDRVGKALDSLGHAQARLTGERFASLPIHIDRLVSSTFTRAAQTADDIGTALHRTAARDSDLCECTPLSNREGINRRLAPGEAEACAAALERVYARYFTPAIGAADRHDVLVAHGNVTRWLVCRALGVDLSRWAEFAIGNASITALFVRPDGQVSLATFSDTGHLPANTQTWTGRGAGWSPPLPGASTTTPPIVNRGVSAPAPDAARDSLRPSPRPSNR